MYLWHVTASAFEPVIKSRARSSEEGALPAPRTSSGFHPALTPEECYAATQTEIAHAAAQPNIQKVQERHRLACVTGTGTL